MAGTIEHTNHQDIPVDRRQMAKAVIGKSRLDRAEGLAYATALHAVVYSVEIVPRLSTIRLNTSRSRWVRSRPRSGDAMAPLAQSTVTCSGRSRPH